MEEVRAASLGGELVDLVLEVCEDVQFLLRRKRASASGSVSKCFLKCRSTDSQETVYLFLASMTGYGNSCWRV